LKLYSVRNVY